MTVEQVQALIDATPERFRVVVLLGAGCGLRIGEALGVQAALGHASAVETLQIYVGLWPDNDQRTRAAIDDLGLGCPHNPST